ncbi:MAG: hypothetical protein AAB395_01805 [Patescibacteria group bacterium]
MIEAQLKSPGSVNDFAEERGLNPKDALPEYTSELGDYRSQLLGEGSTAVAFKYIKPEMQEEN